MSHGVVEPYVHNAAAPGLGSIGVLVALESAGEADVLHVIGHKIAMHVAASAPLWVSREDIPADVVAEKHAELTEQARKTGKPPAIVEKMVEGRMRKFYEEVVLGLQPFVLNPDQRVGQALKDAASAAGVPIAIKAFVRFQTGEGIGEESRVKGCAERRLSHEDDHRHLAGRKSVQLRTETVDNLRQTATRAPPSRTRGETTTGSMSDRSTRDVIQGAPPMARVMP